MTYMYKSFTIQDLSADALDLVKTAHHYGKKMQYNSVVSGTS